MGQMRAVASGFPSLPAAATRMTGCTVGKPETFIGTLRGRGDQRGYAGAGFSPSEGAKRATRGCELRH
jgi:hypothetical protein